MSILVFSLTASLVAADAPTSVSSEVVEKLDLRGTWVGTSRNAQPITKIKISERSIDINSDGMMVGCQGKVIDEGEGKFCMELEVFGKVDRKLLGIYQWRGDDLLICIRVDKDGRPSNYRSDGVNSVFLLRRVKPGK